MENEDVINGEEYAYSIGNTMMMKTFSELIADPNNRADTIFLNIATLFRNCQDGSLEFSKWIAVANDEIIKIVGDLAREYAAAGKSGERIVLYYQDYTTVIPKEIIRPRTVSRGLLEEGAMILIKKFREVGIPTADDINRELTVTLMKSFTRPDPADLGMHLRKLKTKKNVIMVSHIPMDYHLHKFSHDFNILYSFTGEMLSANTIGPRLFKNEHVPFNRHTHAIFGDKVSFKCLLSIKLKRELYDLAETEKWHLQTEAMILSSMKKHMFNPPFKIYR